MDLRNKNDIKILNKRLLKVITGDYPYPAKELYAYVYKVEISWDYSMYTTIAIRFGRFIEKDHKDNWQKEVEIPLVIDDLEFIAGQFMQVLIDKGL